MGSSLEEDLRESEAYIEGLESGPKDRAFWLVLLALFLGLVVLTVIRM